MSQVMTQAECVDQMCGVSTHQKYWNQVALWMVTWLWNNCAIMSKAEGKLLQVDTSSQILRKQWICEATGPFDGKCSKMHEAEVHLFSDSVFMHGKSSDEVSELKFNNRWKDHLEQYRESARVIDGEQIQFRFHMFLGETDQIMPNIDEWIRQVHGEDSRLRGSWERKTKITDNRWFYTDTRKPNCKAGTLKWEKDSVALQNTTNHVNYLNRYIWEGWT